MKICTSVFKMCTVATLALGLLVLGPVHAQQEESKWTISLEEGPLLEHSSKLNVLLALQYTKNHRLQLDRKLWRQQRRSIEDQVESEIARHIARGMDEERARRLAGRHLERLQENPFLRTQSDFQDAVERFTEVACNRGRGRSGSGDNLTANYRGEEMFVNAASDGSMREVSLHERGGLRRNFSVGDDGAGRFEFLLVGSDYLVRINQFVDKPVHIIMISGDNVFQAKVKDFKEFSETYPEEKTKLFKIMAQVGFDLPLTKENPDVKSFVLKHLSSTQGALPNEFEEIIDGLDANSFEEREEFKKILLENIDKYSMLIPIKLSSDETSAEAKRVLESINSKVLKQFKEGRIARFVQSEKLCNSPKYILKLYEQASADQQKAIVSQLKTLTQQDFGNDLEAWRQYLDTKQQKEN